MFAMRFLFILLLCHLSNLALIRAQIGRNPVFTHQDTLRGSLRPERTCYDVRFYHLKIRVNPADKSIRGSNLIRYTATEAFHTLQLDLFEHYAIEKIVFQGKSLPFTRDGNAFFVRFPSQQANNSQGELEVFYSGKPQVARMPPWDGGFVWKKDNEGKDWIGVACQGLGASSWYPNKDHLSDEPDSMRISCEVPTGLTCVANGNLLNTVRLSDGFTRFDWKVAYPINNYVVSLNIANYAHFTDTFTSTIDGQKLQLDYYVLPYNLQKAQKHFQQVKPMLACYEKFLGKYPFWKDGYCLVETPYLGMEHQSAIAYGNNYLNGYLGRSLTGYPLDFDYIIIHETGHEWWGNLVSMQDVADMWIHEGFCTYTESLYVECMKGKKAAYEYVAASSNIVQHDRPVEGLYGVNYEGSSDMYPKGALMLHTLRNVLDNDKRWFEVIKGILEEFSYQTITSKQLIAYINKKTGKNFDAFFEQYLRHTRPPVLVYSLKEGDTGAKLECYWKTDAKGFDMPLKVRYGGQEQWIYPTNTPASLSLKGNKGPLEFLTDQFYIETEILR
jgi:aminopeptidase N